MGALYIAVLVSGTYIVLVLAVIVVIIVVIVLQNRVG
jgi:hypothetical protein